MRWLCSFALIWAATATGLLIAELTNEPSPPTEIAAAHAAVPASEDRIVTKDAQGDPPAPAVHAKAKTTIRDVERAWGIEGHLTCMVVQGDSEPQSDGGDDGRPTLQDVERDWGIEGHLSCSVQDQLQEE